MSLFAELKRRNVFRVAIAYVVVAWLVLQVADVVLNNIEAPDWVFQTIMLVLVIGFPVILVFAWAFEMTPEGLKREREVDRTQSITGHTSRKLDRLIIGSLALVVAWFAFDEFYREPREQVQDLAIDAPPDNTPQVGEMETPSPLEPDPSAVDRQSVAVLPFLAMSSGEDDGYFADGLTEEIINSLAALPELLVTARTSAFHFKGQDLPVPEIAARLGVDHVVEGSVRRAGEWARITAQLIRAADGFHLWSQTYDRTLDDVFAVQEDIAGNIAHALDVVLDERKRELMRQAGIGDVDAFMAYQKAQEAFYRAHEDLTLTTALLQDVTPLFEEALEAAPDVLAARVLKADAVGHVVFDLASGTRPEAYPGEAEQALNTLRDEYELAWQYARPGNQRDILDVERSLFADDWTGLRGKMERALRPGDCAQTNWTLEMAVAMGFAREALDKVREKLRCDPYQPISNFHLSYLTLWTGEPRAAMRAARDAQDDGVRFAWLQEATAYAALALENFDHPSLGKLEFGNTWIRFPRDILRLAAAGDIEAARALAEEYWDRPDSDDWSSLFPAAMIGDSDRANAFAARMDARPGGSLVLTNVAYACACGAPFDLDATPNFKRKIEQAGFDWPPASPIKWPAKEW